MKKKTDVKKLVTNNALDAKIGAAENKIPDISKLVTNSGLNTKVGEAENRLLIMMYILLLKNLIS